VMEIRLDDAAPVDEAPPEPSPSSPDLEVDVEALERAADARLAQAEAQHAPPPPPTPTPTSITRESGSPGRYQQTRPAGGVTSTRPRRSSRPSVSRPDPASESIFGGDLLSEKSLDEVILSYLAEDADEDKS
jgi:hypothetical protein